MALEKLWFLSIFLFAFGSMFSFALEGQIGVATTTLTSELSDSATTAQVASTAGFSTQTGSNILIIQGEEIVYTGLTPTSFTGLARGQNNTEAATHASGKVAYNSISGRINQAVAFNVAAVDAATGNLWALMQIPGALAGLAATIIKWDYSFFIGQWQLVRYFFWSISAAMILGLIINIGIPLGRGILGR